MYGKTGWYFFSSFIHESINKINKMDMEDVNAKTRDLNKYKFNLNEIKNETSEGHTIVLKFMKDRPLSLTLACVS